MTAGHQELVGLIHPGKRLAGEANRIVAMVTERVTETSLDGALYAPGRLRTCVGRPPKKSEAEGAPKK